MCLSKHFLQWQPCNCAVDHQHSDMMHTRLYVLVCGMVLHTAACDLVSEKWPTDHDLGIAFLLLNFWLGSNVLGSSLLVFQEMRFCLAFQLVSLLLMQDSYVTFLDSQGSSLVFLACVLWSCAQFWEGCSGLTCIPSSLSSSSSPHCFPLPLFATLWIFPSTTNAFLLSLLHVNSVEFKTER